jgi:hypothetical protein
MWLHYDQFFFFAKTHQKVTLTQLFGEKPFSFLKQVAKFCPFVVFLGENVTKGLSTHYTFNGPIQNYH